MASVHLPLFLDGKWTSNFRAAPHMDGYFLSGARDYASDDNSKMLLLGYMFDAKYKEKSLLNAVEALSPDGIYQLLEDGKQYAKQMEEQGKFDCLAK